MYRTIIVPLDGSARAQGALPVAARLARESGAALELVRVHLSDRSDLADDPSWDEMFMQGERSQLAALAEAYESMAGMRPKTSLLREPVTPALCEYVESRPDPLVVIAARGRTGLRRALLGSVSDSLVRRTSAPILVLRDRPDDDDPPSWKLRRVPFGTIVVPLDGSAFAEGSLAHAVALAGMGNASIHLIRVVEPEVSAAVFGAFAMHPLPPFDQTSEAMTDGAHEYLQSVIDRATVGRHLRITREVALSTQTASAIVESCRRHAADLVVMATHGRGASRLLVGAVADRLIKEGPDAILFVRPEFVGLPAGLHVAGHDSRDPEKPRVPAVVT